MSRVSSSARDVGTDTKTVESTRRASRLRMLGVLLLGVGLCCLGCVAYQYIGTNLVAQHAYRAEAKTLRAVWLEQRRSDPQGTSQLSPRPGEAIGLLRIPALGAGYEVPILSGTRSDVVAKGVGHYASTALSGQIGNFALTGFRVTQDSPSPGSWDWGVAMRSSWRPGTPSTPTC